MNCVYCGSSVTVTVVYSSVGGNAFGQAICDAGCGYKLETLGDNVQEVVAWLEKAANHER